MGFSLIYHYKPWDISYDFYSQCETGENRVPSNSSLVIGAPKVDLGASDAEPEPRDGFRNNNNNNNSNNDNDNDNDNNNHKQS